MVSCRLCGLSLRLEVEQKNICAKLLSLWRILFVMLPGREGEANIHLRFVSRGRFTPPRDPPINASRQLTVWRTESGYLLQCGATSTLEVNLARSQVVGRLDPSFWEYPTAEQREFFLLCFLMLLRPHGRYGLHANGLCGNNDGVLVVGPSGCGKTTLSVALVSQGSRYVGDDALILHQKHQGVEAMALRRGFSCTPNTADWFPALKAAVAKGLNVDGKRLADLEGAFPGSFIAECTPKVLLFPRLAPVPHSQLRPLDETKTLTSLMRQSPGIFAHQAYVVEQLKVLKSLVRQCRSYEIELGSDVYDRPERLSRLIEGAAG